MPVHAASRILPSINVQKFVEKYAIAEPIMKEVNVTARIRFNLNLFMIYALEGIITPITNRNVV